MTEKKRKTKKQWQKIGLAQAPPEELERAFDQAETAIIAVLDAASDSGYTSDTLAALTHLAGILQDEIEDAKRVMVSCLHEEIDFLRSRMNSFEKAIQTQKA